MHTSTKHAVFSSMSCNDAKIIKIANANAATHVTMSRAHVSSRILCLKSCVYLSHHALERPLVLVHDLQKDFRALLERFALGVRDFAVWRDLDDFQLVDGD